MKWNLRKKVLLLSALTALLPFATTNIYWYVNSQNTNRKNSEDTIVFATSQATDKINDFLNTKLLGFLVHSQGPALLNGDNDLVREDLLNLLLQDPDIQTLTYVDISGLETVKVDKQHVYEEESLHDISNTDEFKVASFKFGKEYIGPVTYENGPQIKIAVPIAYPKNAQSLRTFSSGSNEGRYDSEVRGVLLSTVSLNQLAKNLNSLQINQSGYLYLISKEGRLITYKDNSLIGTFVGQSGTEASRFISSGQTTAKTSPVKPTQSLSLSGIPVLSSHEKIDRTNWGVIAEVPMADISQSSTNIQQKALLLSLIPLTALLALSLYFARKLINPIQSLVSGTQSISQGNFDFNFGKIKTGDEIEQLALAYADMASKVEHEQHSLTAEKNTLSTVLSSIVDGVVALDKEYRVVFINQAASTIMGINQEQVAGKPLDGAIQLKEKGADCSIPILCQQYADTGTTQKLTLMLNQTESKSVNLVVSSIPPSLVTSICYILTFYDSTKEQELENMKLDFVSMAAHELRTPLTAIKGYLSYLDEELGEKLSEEQKTYLSRVIISSDQLSSLIENLLNVTKIERGILKLDMASFSLEKMIESTLVNLREVSSQKHIEISFEKPPHELPEILGDQFRINQVFTNLVSNAINYTQPDGWIKIGMERRPDSIIVSVKDNGQGIPMTALPHLFTKFYRVGGSLEQGSKGTGLGLFISKSIIDRHNGKIWVESEEGKGSTFFFMLPIDSKESHDK